MVVSKRQEIFIYMTDNPKALPEKVKEKFPDYKASTVETYIKQWRKQKYKGNNKRDIPSDNNFVTLPKDCTSLTPEMIESIIVERIKEDQSPNMIRTMVDYYTKVKINEPDNIEKIDMKKFLKNVT